MNKAFEKIIDELKQESIIVDDDAGHRAVEIIEQMAKEYNGGWIACSERLPEKNDMYLCTQNTYDLATNKKIINVSTELVEFYNGKWRRAKNLVITHWQPLPQPYKEREHNG